MVRMTSCDSPLGQLHPSPSSVVIEHKQYYEETLYTPTVTTKLHTVASEAQRTLLVLKEPPTPPPNVSVITNNLMQLPSRPVPPEVHPWDSTHFPPGVTPLG